VHPYQHNADAKQRARRVEQPVLPHAGTPGNEMLVDFVCGGIERTPAKRTDQNDFTVAGELPHGVRCAEPQSTIDHKMRGFSDQQVQRIRGFRRHGYPKER